MPEQKITQNVKPGESPAFKLNLADRFFLAVARQTSDKLVFIYTLGCAGENRRYNAFADVDIATFDDKNKAAIYYQTVKAALEYCKKTPLYETLLDFNAELVKTFNEQTKGK
jgi:hypothetical protein